MAVANAEPVGLWFCGCIQSESTRRLNRQWFWFKMSQKTGPHLKVSSDGLGEPGIELGTPGYKANCLSTTPTTFKVVNFI